MLLIFNVIGLTTQKIYLVRQLDYQMATFFSFVNQKIIYKIKCVQSLGVGLVKSHLAHKCMTPRLEL